MLLGFCFGKEMVKVFGCCLCKVIIIYVEYICVNLCCMCYIGWFVVFVMEWFGCKVGVVGFDEDMI